MPTPPISGFVIALAIQVAVALRLKPELRASGARDWVPFVLVGLPLLAFAIGLTTNFGELSVVAVFAVTAVLLLGLFVPTMLIRLTGGPKPILALARLLDRTVDLCLRFSKDPNPATGARIRELLARLEPIDGDTRVYIDAFREIVDRWLDESPAPSPAFRDDALRMQEKFIIRLEAEGIDTARI